MTLPDCVQSEIRLFVDDTILFKIFDDMDQAANELNNDLNSVNAWAKKWLVTFTPAKTESLFVTTKHNLMFPPLHLGGGIVKEVTAHKHLGVILSSNLSWNEHIDDRCLRASKRLDILRALKYMYKLSKAFDNKTWVDHFKETEIYRQWKKSLKWLIVDISQLWNLRRRQKNRRHCH